LRDRSTLSGNPQANGSQSIYWYDQWLETGDRTFLDIIQRYNEDDCRATRHVKDWLGNFIKMLPVGTRLNVEF